MTDRPTPARPSLEDRLSTGTPYAFVTLGAGLALVLIVAVKAVVFADLAPDSDPGSMMPNDFSAFYAAAATALAHGPVAVTDLPTLQAAQLYAPADYAANGGEVYLPFLYPPAVLAFLLPLGTVTYVTAFALLAGLSVAFWSLAAALVAPPGRRPLYVCLALTAPAFLLVLNTGQIIAFWTGTLVLALVALDAGRAVLAGALIGLLTIKPQLGPLVALALVAGGHWRAVAAAAATTLLLHGATTVWAGLDYWEGYLARLDEFSARFAHASDQLDPMISVMIAARPLGDTVASVLHWGVAVILALTVALVWRRGEAPFEAKAAVLLCAIPLATPYSWHHESLTAFAGALFLMRLGLGRSLSGQMVLVALWAGIGVAALMRDTLPMGVVYAPIMTAGVVAAAAQAGLGRRPASTPAAPLTAAS